jgi:hypothetical protein
MPRIQFDVRFRFSLEPFNGQAASVNSKAGANLSLDSHLIFGHRLGT